MLADVLVVGDEEDWGLIVFLCLCLGLCVFIYLLMGLILYTIPV